MPLRSLPACLLLPVAIAAGPLEDLKPGEWYEAPDSRMDAVKPDPMPPGYMAAVTDAWSGAAFDSKRDRLIVWGGGHGDYSGNELYAFDVGTLKWTRLTEPSQDVGGDEKSGVYPDGKPRSRHTYNSLQYIAARDRLCAFGGAGLYPSGQVGTARTECFDFGSAAWVRMADAKTFGIANFSAYEPRSGTVWAGKGALTRFDPAADAWGKQTVFDNDLEWTNYLTMDADPQGMLLAVGGGKSYLWFVGPQAILIPTQPGPSKGAEAIVSAPAPGLAFDPVIGGFVAWAGGGTVYSYTLGAVEWTSHPAAGKTLPTAPNANGTYGRFRYVPSKNVFILVNRTNENVFFYKLDGKPGANILTPVKKPKPIANPHRARNLQGRRIRHYSGFLWSVP